MEDFVMGECEMIILGIETSCDETAAAVLRDGRVVLSDVIYSQIDIHKEYGGVVPEIASRNHLDKISPCVDEALALAGVGFSDLDAIGVTYGAGLVGALLVGVCYAKGLSLALERPLIAVNHIQGHICSNYVCHEELEPPFLCLVASGGHTTLAIVKSYTEYEIIGQTVDDAAGEAYDKVARTLGLSYPGGPIVDKLAQTGTASIAFPRAFMGDDNFNFSFSGLKSAVLNYVNKQKARGGCVNVPDVCASFQEAVSDVLCKKTISAAKKYGIKKIAAAGGASANSLLRAELAFLCEDNGFELYLPSLRLCTDNAVMIAARAYFDFRANKYSDMSLNAVPNLRL
ncbi:tRNA N6-adenosine threonylcarbamoyltransferase [Clostridia bacterium]|nr:tRNA N6-adenosine threonylcarbamoyltransferase [Clostridia bacterium]